VGELDRPHRRGKLELLRAESRQASAISKARFGLKSRQQAPPVAFHELQGRPLLPLLIAEKARCCRDTVYEAILALEATGVFSWVNRIDRVAERVKDLFGNWTNVYRIVRRSNVYQFRDPLPCAEALNSLRSSSKSENPPEPEIQDLPSSTSPPKIIVLDPANPLDGALIRFGRTTGAL
jgi:hypothetical protein